MRALAESHDAEVKAAAEGSKAELDAKKADFVKLESAMKSARVAAGRAESHLQVHISTPIHHTLVTNNTSLACQATRIFRSYIDPETDAHSILSQDCTCT